MRRNKGRLAAVATAFALSALSATAPARADAPHAALLAAMQAEAGTAAGGDGIPGIIAEVYQNGTTWNGSVAQDANTPVRNSAGEFRAGSVTKIFTATVVLQLVAEGRLKLSDDVFTLLGPVLKQNAAQGCDLVTRQCFNPPSPTVKPITVEDLLHHSSGVFNNLQDGALLAQIAASFPNLPQYSEQQLIDIGASHGPQFAPGTSMAYGNTNYNLLGMVIEKITGDSWDTEVTRRIIDPLGLSGTYLPGTSSSLPQPHDAFYTNYMQRRTALGHLSRPAADWDPSVAGAAGSLVSTDADLLTFIRALVGGRLLPPAELNLMTTDFNPNVVGTPGSGPLPAGLTCDPALIWPECIANPRVSTANSGDANTPSYWYAAAPWISGKAEYGLGLTQRTLTCQDGHTVVVYGHDGAALGSFTYLYSTIDGSHAIALNYNGDWALWELYSLYGELSAEFC